MYARKWRSPVVGAELCGRECDGFLGGSEGQVDVMLRGVFKEVE